MPLLAVPTPFNIELEFQTAPFGKRLLAWALDALVQGVYWLAFYVAVHRRMSHLPDSVQGLLTTLLLVLPLASYHFLQEVFVHGQSLGKRVLGLRVVSLKGGEPTLSQYALRSVLRLVDVGPLFGLPAAVCCGVTPLGQRIGDLAAGTVVIEKEASGNLAATIYRPVDLTDYQVRHPEVMQLTDRDINGIRNLLQVETSLGSDAYALKIADRIKEVLRIADEREPRVFLEGLLTDYNALTQGDAAHR